jgi:hypothetical protein
MFELKKSIRGCSREALGGGEGGRDERVRVYAT